MSRLARRDPARRRRPARVPTSRASLVGLGVATPPERWEQSSVSATLIDLFDLEPEAQRRLQRILNASGIAARHAVMPVEQIVPLGTKARMEAYERLAPPLAAEAARSALEPLSGAADRVSDLIVVSCTGFSAPGLDTALIRRLELPPTVRRTIIGFMGCFGAIVGLRMAAAACRSDPRAVVLVVCLELCSLHVRNERSVENQVATALFADGAAAAVVCGSAWEGPVIGGLGAGHSLLIDEERDSMTWRVTDSGFAMTLSREVPRVLRERLAAFVDSVAGPAVATYIVHPGGPEILDAADEALGLGGRRGLAAARAVLRRCGNMSSATVVFVLEEALRAGEPLPALLLAFGPGLTLECLRLEGAP